MSYFVKKKWKISLEVVITMFFVAICLIEFLKPLTRFPYIEKQILWEEIALSHHESIWAKFGLFGGQFAFFTNWSNWLFIGTIIYGWILRKKVTNYWKNAISVYLFMTTVIFFVGIAPFLIWGASIWVDYIAIHEHLLVTLCWMAFLFSTQNQKIKSLSKSVVITLAMPIVYFTFTLIVYLIYEEQVAVYPFLNFLNVFNLGLNSSISIVVSIIVLTFIISGIITANYLFYELNDYQSIHKKRVRYFHSQKSKKAFKKNYD